MSGRDRAQELFEKRGVKAAFLFSLFLTAVLAYWAWPAALLYVVVMLMVFSDKIGDHVRREPARWQD